MKPVLLFADRLPPLIGGMEMHAGAFIDHFSGHPRWPLAGVITRDRDGEDCLLQGDRARRFDLPDLPGLLGTAPAIVFFNSGRWIEDLPQLRDIFPRARFVYRTGGNEILKAPLVRQNLESHVARQRWWVARLNATLDQLITNSAYTEKRLEDLGLPPSLFARCVGGVDAEELMRARPQAQPRSARRPVRLFCAARFVPYKNHLLLLDVFERLMQQGVDAELRLAGDGPLLDDARRRAAVGPLASRVTFLGRLSNEEVCRELANADALIQLSGERTTSVPGGSYVHAEGMGRSILEALACGVFVIAPRTGALPEILTPDRGQLLDLSTAESVADQLAPLLATPLPSPSPLRGLGWPDYFHRYELLWEEADAAAPGH